MSNQPTADRIPEDRVAMILARAAELDERTRHSVDIDQLRAAAVEAGISRGAVDRALHEYRVGRQATPGADAPESPAAGGRFRRWLRKLLPPVGHGLVAFVVGLLAASADPDGEAVIILGMLAFVALAGVLVRRGRRTRRVVGFQLSTALITLGGFLGFAGANGDEDVMITLLLLGAALAVIGTAAIKLRRPRPPAVVEIAESLR